MVIEDLEHVLAPPKLLGSDAHFRRYGALKIWGKPDARNLKPHQFITRRANPTNFNN